MTLMHDDVLVVAGVSVCHVSWFAVDTHSLLLASATADAARISQKDRWQQQRPHDGGTWTENEDVQLDFVLYGAKASAMNDTSEVVDYTFLTAQPQPSRVPGEALVAYQARLKHWMETCYAAHYAARFIDHLRSASPALSFEYDSVLKLISSADGQRTVRGLVAPALDGSGHHLISFTVPLFVTGRAAKVFQSLNNVAVLYCTMSHVKWKPSYQLTSVEADVHTRFRTAQRTGRITLIAESVVLRLRDAAAAGGEAGATTEGRAADSLISFLHSCVDLYGLPRLSMAQQGAGFLDHIPRLEHTLYRRIREPLHFMKLVLGLMADFGSPIDVSASCRALTATVDSATPQLPLPWSPQQQQQQHPPPMRRTATFCVVDRTTAMSFTIGLHYQSGDEFPSVETTCNQYLDAQHGATVSRRVKFSRSASSMRKDDDGFLDVEDLRVIVVRETLECMSGSAALA
ncbi:conserved hypothetical protein [Leishmania major strain Friedlin]|uniref:Uncharacterized protein n=1 Tax=Leishmania major TaxID=5664 RepID=Q4QJ72_LEIMA|nr:conserved hypothetical protein [Leishmania major strain Friedlin]CAG9568799.1 hypothetical_protein [Leishmania major strain Friedlin]CAJ02050.1 conserved hypothetical protein [Leishmania major strain Friedlin]|eukprot:XP_001680776.1 conserved hypothetical protein [Leishmania major strain Friedlin]